jgi:hypothetical protein
VTAWGDHTGGFQQNALRVSQWAAVATGFCISMPTPAAEVCLAVSAVAWFLSGTFAAVWRQVRSNALVLAAAVCLASLILGLLYSPVDWDDAIRSAGKYRDFLFIPVFSLLFSDGLWRRRGMTAFAAGVLVLVGGSWVEYGVGLDIGQLSAPDAITNRIDHVTFKDRINHNALAVFGAYLFAWQAMTVAQGRRVAIGAALLCLGSVLLLVQGRTGYAALGALALVLCLQRFGWRGLLVVATTGSLFVAVGYAALDGVRSRVQTTVEQIQNHFGPERRQSADPRLEFYDMSVRIWSHRPLWGWGTGAFGHEYKNAARPLEMRPTEDPHNEFLLWGVERGLVGFVVLLGFFITAWKTTDRLGVDEAAVARGLVALLFVSCLFNSWLLSHTGGHMLAFFGGLSWSNLGPRTEGLLADEDECVADAIAFEAFPRGTRPAV